MQNKETKNLEDSASYVNPITLKPFEEMESPVMDSEGYVREKEETDINLGIYSRNSVTIIESSDLKKIQHDYRSLKTKVHELTNTVHALSNTVENLLKRFDENEKKWAEEKKAFAEKEKKWDKEREEDRKAWADERKAWTDERKTWQGEKRELLAQIDEKDKQLREEKAKNNILIAENLILTQQIEAKNQDLSDDEEKNDPDGKLENVELNPWKGQKILSPEAKGKPRDTYLGFKHTIFDSYFPREKLENDLRIAAYEGNDNRVNALLKEDKSLVNGRGMPDSLGSTVKSWNDKTALMLASQKGHLNCVKTLLGYGADPNYLDRDDLTALDYAQQGWHKNTADVLRESEGMNGMDLVCKFGCNTIQEEELTIR